MGQLPAFVWLQLLLLLAALFVAIFGGAWILRWLFADRRRADTHEVADDGSAIKTLTVAVETMKGGLFSARYLADEVTDHRGLPTDPPPSATLADLRDVVDAAIAAWYGAKLAPEAMVVDYAMYPWNEGDMPEDLAERIGTDWLVFDVEESGG